MVLLQQTVRNAVSQIDATRISQEDEQVQPDVLVDERPEQPVMQDFAESTGLHDPSGVTARGRGYPGQAGESADGMFGLRHQDVDRLDVVLREPLFSGN